MCSKGGRVGVRRATKLHTAQSPSRFCAQQGGGGAAQTGGPRRVRGGGGRGVNQDG